MSEIEEIVTAHLARRGTEAEPRPDLEAIIEGDPAATVVQITTLSSHRRRTRAAAVAASVLGLREQWLGCSRSSTGPTKQA